MKLNKWAGVFVLMLALAASAFAQTGSAGPPQGPITDIGEGSPQYDSRATQDELNRFANELASETGVQMGTVGGAPTSLNAARNYGGADPRSSAGINSAVGRYMGGGGGGGIAGGTDPAFEWDELFTSVADKIVAALVLIVPLALGLMAVFMLIKLVMRWVKKVAH